MPRPKKTCGQRRTHIIAFRLTDAEFDKLECRATAADTSANNLARIVTISDTDRITIKAYAASDPALIKRFDRLANNLNQLVKNAHVFGRISPQVAELCEQIKAIIIETTNKE